jgi:hypothetical protein
MKSSQPSGCEPAAWIDAGRGLSGVSVLSVPE